jgi:hypothetical protein
MVRDGLIDPEHYYGTINMDGVNSRGEVSGVTTTSGLAWKIPGRVGDSPILGAGLYVDGEIGAAGSTGRGEANLFNLCSYLLVEEMRRGRHPRTRASRHSSACRRTPSRSDCSMRAGCPISRGFAADARRPVHDLRRTRVRVFRRLGRSRVERRRNEVDRIVDSPRGTDRRLRGL